MTTWTQWFTNLDDRVISTAILAVLLYVAVRLLEWGARQGIKDDRRRYTVNKVIRYGALSIFFISVTGIWAQRLQGFLLIMGATGAGLAIALSPVIVSMAGWILIIWTRLYQVGDRIQLGGVMGDVVDIGIIRTTLLEIGNWVDGDQMTGRIVTVTNAAVFKDPCFNYTQGSPFIWDEFMIPIAYGPAWTRAQTAILDTLNGYASETEQAARTAMNNLPGVALVGLPDVRPQTYITLTEHWMACRIRYVVEARIRRTVKHRLQTAVLSRLATENIEIASPALTVVKYPAERTWKEST